MQKSDKYLGLPAMMGRSKKLIFSSIHDRICKMLRGWKEKLLSQAGKKILIKPIAQAVLNYTMSCFKLHQLYVTTLKHT